MIVSALELEAIRAFVARVNACAERTIELTHKIEGAHYNAMQVELAELEKRITATNDGDNVLHAEGER